MPKPATNSFDAVASHLDRGGSFYLYIDTAPWLAGLGKQIDSLRDLALLNAGKTSPDEASRETMKTGFALINDLVTKSGLEEISGLGASSIAIEPGVSLNKLFIHHYSDKANGFLWSTFGKAPHHLDLLDCLPLNTALATSSDLDLGNLLAGLREEVEKSGMPNATQGFDTAVLQFTAMFGMSLDDLLKSLDGSVGLILTLDQTKTITVPIDGHPTPIPSPRLAILLRVKDDKIFSQIDKLLGANPGVKKHDDDSLHMRGVPAPGPMEAWLSPTVVQWARGYLLIASDETIINDIVAAQKTGQGFKSTPQFTTLMTGLPQEGNAFQIVTPLFGETFRMFQREALKNQPTMTPDQLALMDKLFNQSATPVSIGTISSHLADGWLIASKGASGASMLLGPALIAPAALAAGIAFPVFGNVQDKGKETKSLSQAKQLAIACKLYALDNQGKFPPTLEALVPDYLADKTLFASPFRPEVPTGYTYTPGLKDTDPPATILIEDKFSPEKHQRIVAHVDSSGEVLHLPKTGAP